MSYYFMRCKDCDEEVEVFCDGDNPMMCPECRSVDNFEEIVDELCTSCNGSGEGYYDGSRCVICNGSGVA